MNWMNAVSANNDSIYTLVFNGFCSISLLSRCVPDPAHLADLLIQHAAANKTAEVVQRQQSTQLFFKLIEPKDFFQKFLSDIYTAWREIVALCGIAVGENLRLIVICVLDRDSNAVLFT